MSCCSFAITKSMWGEATDVFQKNTYNIEKDDGCVYTLFKHGVNGVCKGFALLAMAVVAIVTPIFVLFDLIYSATKSLCCYEVKPVHTTSVLEFYRGEKTHDTGLTLDEILAKDDDWLEGDHDFIQWLFPLESKGVNPNASLTNSKTQETFRKDPELQANMRKALDRMLKFYGMEFASNEYFNKDTVKIASNFRQRIQNLLDNPHNNKRITRILKSLNLHGLENEAQSFVRSLKVILIDNSAACKSLKEVYLQHWKPEAPDQSDPFIDVQNKR